MVLVFTFFFFNEMHVAVSLFFNIRFNVFNWTIWCWTSSSSCKLLKCYTIGLINVMLPLWFTLSHFAFFQKDCAKGKMIYGRWINFRSDQKYVIINQPKPVSAFAEISDLFWHYHNNCSSTILPCRLTSPFNLVVVHFLMLQNVATWQKGKTPGINVCQEKMGKFPRLCSLNSTFI